jgi:DNA invertase Pin-like site-specific DNA recombinase
MKVGYARVSTRDQNLELQIEALQNSGCEEIFSEKISAAKERPELEKMISILRKGDVVIVWKLDRLGRSLRHLLNLVTMFREKNVEFVSLNDNIDTTTIHGRLIFNIFASFAEFERELISERTRAGLEAARKKGRVGGRKPGLNKESQAKAYMAHALMLTDKPVQDILKILKLSKSTYYRYLDWVRDHPDKGKKRRVRSVSKK